MHLLKSDFVNLTYQTFYRFCGANLKFQALFPLHFLQHFTYHACGSRIPSLAWSHSMTLIRHSLMLVLVVAMLVPPQLARSCCCSSRVVTSQTAQSQSLRPCCLAKAKKAIRVSRYACGSSISLRSSQCKCVSHNPARAILRADEKQAFDQSWTVCADEVTPFDQLNSVKPYDELGSSIVHDVGPPLRTMLCRWVI